MSLESKGGIIYCHHGQRLRTDVQRPFRAGRTGVLPFRARRQFRDHRLIPHRPSLSGIDPHEPEGPACYVPGRYDAH